MRLPPLPPGYQAAPTDDWWTRLYADRHDTHGTPRPPSATPEQQPVTVTVTVPQHPQQQQLSSRTRNLAYNATAGALGWGCGLGPFMHHAITECGTATHPGAGIALGVGIAAVAAVPDWYLRGARNNHHPLGTAVAWCARVPLASAVLALALYTPGTLQ